MEGHQRKESVFSLGEKLDRFDYQIFFVRRDHKACHPELVQPLSTDGFPFATKTVLRMIFFKNNRLVAYLV